MKKIFLLIIFSLFLTSTYAIDVNENFGFVPFSPNDIVAYKQYVGQRVAFINRSYDAKYRKLSFTPDLENIYIIKNIKTKIKDKSSMPYVELKISLQQENGKKKINIKAPSLDNISAPIKMKLGAYATIMSAFEMSIPVSKLPLYFVDEFNKTKESELGTFINYPHCKVTYQIKDIRFENGVVKYNLECSKDNKRLTLDRKFDRKTFFELNHFQGNYNCSLVSVEKPTDSENRYGETTNIVEDNITKYKFVDDYINILIFNTKSQFH